MQTVSLALQMFRHHAIMVLKSKPSLQIRQKWPDRKYDKNLTIQKSNMDGSERCVIFIYLFTYVFFSCLLCKCVLQSSSVLLFVHFVFVYVICVFKYTIIFWIMRIKINKRKSPIQIQREIWVFAVKMSSKVIAIIVV